MNTRGGGGIGKKAKELGKIIALVFTKVGRRRQMVRLCRAKTIRETQRVHCGTGRGRSAEDHKDIVTLQNIVQQDTMIAANSHIIRLFS